MYDITLFRRGGPLNSKILYVLVFLLIFFFPVHGATEEVEMDTPTKTYYRFATLGKQERYYEMWLMTDPDTRYEAMDRVKRALAARAFDPELRAFIMGLPPDEIFELLVSQSSMELIVLSEQQDGPRAWLEVQSPMRGKPQGYYVVNKVEMRLLKERWLIVFTNVKVEDHH
ncbi:hypothetical protein CL654_02510 [bacterium]|nr:hypothetical protein [bacterium]|tara:strand:- start:355 stop:867 length:513 start_codon:yes stop_codon:yes gene_type:complete